MIDEPTETQASLYVLGALPPDEARAFEAALRADRQLALLVKELRGTASAMVAAFPQVAPPPALKQRTLAAIEARAARPENVIVLDDNQAAPAWMGWMPWALAACFAILCVLLISIGQSLRQQAVTLNQQLEERNSHAADLQQQLETLQARTDRQITNYQTRLVELQQQVVQRIEDLNRQTAALTNRLQQQQADTERRLVVLRTEGDQLRREKKVLEDALKDAVAGVSTSNTDRYANARIGILRSLPGGPVGATGAALWSPLDQRGVLIVEGLPRLPPTQSYQLWLLDRQLPAPISAGVLPEAAGGSLRVSFTGGTRVDPGERFAISVEPRGGSASPTTVIMASN
jgi:anti-sigma-K factor RskA